MTEADAASLIARLREERSKLPAGMSDAIVATGAGEGAHVIDVGLTAEGLLAVTFPAPQADVVFPIELPDDPGDSAPPSPSRSCGSREQGGCRIGCLPLV